MSSASTDFQAEFLEILGLWTLHVQAQIGWLNFAAAAHQHRALKSVFEFANISRPGILRHRLESGALEAIDFTAITGSVTPQKMDGKSGNIFATLAQRRNMNLDRVEAEEKIFAKLASQRTPHADRYWWPR